MPAILCKSCKDLWEIKLFLKINNSGNIKQTIWDKLREASESRLERDMSSQAVRQNVLDWVPNSRTAFSQVWRLEDQGSGLFSSGESFLLVWFVDGCLLGFLTGGGLWRGEGEIASFSYKGHSPIGLKLYPMTSFSLNYFWKTFFPDIVTGWVGNSVLSRKIHFIKYEVKSFITIWISINSKMITVKRKCRLLK